MSSDSGPNLGVRGVATLLVLGGLWLILRGRRDRGGGRLRLPAPARTRAGSRAAVFVGVVAVGLGAALLGATL